MNWMLALMIGIMWSALSMIAIRTMEEFDGGSTPFAEFRWYWKLLLLLVGPIAYLIWDRHILEGGARTMSDIDREVNGR